MNHEKKVKLATKMNGGVRNHCFDSDAWVRRKQAIVLRLLHKGNEDKPLSWFKQHVG